MIRVTKKEIKEEIPTVIIPPVSVKKNLSLPLVLLLIVTTTLAIYFGYKLVRITNTAKETSQKEISDLVNKVEQLIFLPADETPILATVTDLEKLKGQPFFVNAKLGDKVLIYTKAGKAILYNPGTNKIVDVSPLNLGASSTKTGQTESSPTKR